jgi:hypothetical protein
MASSHTVLLRRAAAPKRVFFRKKRVHFSLTKEVFLDTRKDYGCDDSEDDVCSLWWTRSDLELFKWEASLLVSQVKYDGGLNDCFSQAIESAGRVASCTKNELKLQRKLENLNVDAFLGLWCDGLERGIEKFLRRCISGQRKTNSRTSQKLSYRKTVIIHQARLTDEQLRAKCLSRSRQDRVFARMMGQADAHCALSGLARSSSTFVSPWLRGAKEAGKLVTSSKVALTSVFGGHQSLRHRQFTSKQA